MGRSILLWLIGVPIHHHLLSFGITPTGLAVVRSYRLASAFGLTGRLRIRTDEIFFRGTACGCVSPGPVTVFFVGAASRSDRHDRRLKPVSVFAAFKPSLLDKFQSVDVGEVTALLISLPMQKVR
jgi:hypothetical protein